MTFARKLMNLVVMPCLVMLAACDDTSVTGSAAIDLIFQAPSDDSALRGLLTGVVDAVRVEVRDDSGPLVQKAFSYDDLHGTVDGIPAGTNRSFLVEALSGDTVVYHGTALGVTIVAGDTADVAVVLSSAYQEDVYSPAAVSDLAANPQGADVLLSWSASGDDGLVGRAGSYDIRWSLTTIQASNFDAATTIPGAPIPALAGEQETFTVTGLSPDTTYHFALRVADDDGNSSGVSNEAIATLGAGDDTPPDAIVDLSVESFDTSSVTLSWTAPGDDGAQGIVAQYDVRYSTSEITTENFDQAQTAQGPSSPVAAGQSQTLTIAGLTEGQVYYFSVKSADEVPNWSAISNVVQATPADVVAPDAVTLSVDAVADTSVTLGWLAPGDDGSVGTADSYEIRYSTESIDAGNFASATLWDSAPSPQVAGSAQSVTITPLLEGTQYYFALVSHDDAGNPSPLSNVVMATPGEQDTTPPADVVDLAVESVADSSITLTWTAPGDDGSSGNPVAAYDVRWASSAIADDASFDLATPFAWPGGTQILAAGQTQTLQVTGLEQDQTYFFALKARDEFSNWSGVSNSPSGTTVDQTPPSDISDLQVSDFGDDYLTVQWTAPGDDADVGTATSYEVYYSDTAFDDYSTATSWANVPSPQIAGTSQSVTITGLVPGAEVFVRIRTGDEVPNWSGLSNQVNQTLSCSACPVISSIRPAAAPVGSVVYLDGTNFGATQGTSTMTFGGVDAVAADWTDTRVTAIVPSIPAGVAATVEISTTDGTAARSFAVTPYIDSLTPDSIAPPGSVIIAGSGFGENQGTSTVEIVGSTGQPTVTSWSDDSVSIDVPANVTTGPVKITVGSNSSNTPVLTVDPMVWTTAAYVVDDTNPSFTPRISADSQDYLQLVWVETDGTHLQVFSKERGGSGWNLSAQDLSSSVVDSASPILVNMSASQFLVAWLDGTALSATVGFGEVFSAVDAVDAGPAFAPCVAMLPDGQALMVWAAGDGTSLNYSLRDGSGQWSLGTSAFATSGNSSSVACASDPAGFVHVVFTDGTDLGHSVFDGAQWSDPESIQTLGADPASVKPSVAIGQRGEIHIVYWDEGLYYHAVKKGATWSDPVAVASITSAASARPALIVDNAGVLHLAVEDDQGAERAVMYLSMPPEGTWTAPVEISTAGDTFDASTPDLAEGVAMSIHMVWSEGNRIYISSLQ